MGERVLVKLFEDSKEKEFIGRCLGFLSPEEYENSINCPKLIKNLFGVMTKTISEITRPKGNNINSLNLGSHRLAFAVKKIEDDVIVGKKLVITSPLEYVSVESEDNSEVWFTGKNCYLMVEKVVMED